MANTSILAAFERMWQHTVAALGDKADKADITEINTNIDSTVVSHNTDEEAHVDIRQRIDNIDSTVTSHNTDEEAHADIRQRIDSIDAESLGLSDTMLLKSKTITIPNAPKNAIWSSVAYGNGKFVAVASTNIAGITSHISAYSTDGITWNDVNMPSAAEWYSVTYGAGKFIALSSDSSPSIAAYSTDGITWNEFTMPVAGFWHRIAYGNGKFVAIAYQNNAVSYSEDGITWNSSTFSLPNGVGNWSSIAYGNGKFVALDGNRNRAIYSTDGIAWNESTLPSTTTYWSSIAYGNGKFISLSNGDSAVAAYSTDGVTWNELTIPVAGFSKIHYACDKFICFNSSKLIYSEDGTTWNESSVPSANTYVSNVTYGNGKYVGVFYRDNITAYSYDGINWTTEGISITDIDNITITEDVRKALGIEDNNYVPTTRTINEKTLDNDITLSASDVGAFPIEGGAITGANIYTNGGTGRIMGDAQKFQIESWNTAGDDTNRRILEIHNSSSYTDIAGAIAITDRVNGINTRYKLYGEHNKPNHAAVGAVSNVNGIAEGSIRVQDTGNNSEGLYQNSNHRTIIGARDAIGVGTNERMLQITDATSADTLTGALQLIDKVDGTMNYYNVIHEGNLNLVKPASIGAASTTTYTVSVPASWTANSAGGYNQTVTVTGMLATDNPITDVVLGDDVAANADALKAWSLVTRISTAANSITLYANGDAPATAFTIQMKVIR